MIKEALDSRALKKALLTCFSRVSCVSGTLIHPSPSFPQKFKILNGITKQSPQKSLKLSETFL